MAGKVINPISATTDYGTTGDNGGRPVVYNYPIQIVGLNPVDPCVDDCKSWDSDCCFRIPVFAELATTTPDTDPNTWDNSANDQSSFLFSAPSYTTGATNTTTVLLQLQKLSGSTWSNIITFHDNTFGIYFGFYSLPIYYYTGMVIKWRTVLNNFGEGCYRFTVSYNISNRVGALCSEPYTLREYSCKRTHGTVKFDTFMYDGDIADINIDGFRQQLCGINWHDSIRVPGFFGYEESESEKRQTELTDGQILSTRDELIQKFKFISSPLPKWFHDRFKAYGTMKAGQTDLLRVTDYNWNNSDYKLVRKYIVRDGGYSPKYKIGSRLSTVEVIFREHFQNVSRSSCCGTVFGGK